MAFVVHNVHGSNFANFMIKLMAAEKIRNMAPSAILSNYNLPEWNIHHPSVASDDDLVCAFTDDMRINPERVRYLARSGVKRFDMHGHLQRMENFPDRAQCSALFSARPVDVSQISADEILCPVRGAEILAAIHPGYPLVPIEFYADVARQFGLRPVFMGQTDANPYMDALRAAFPSSRILPHVSAMLDFEIIRSAAKIVLPISTFAWTAAWLSEAELVIQPLFGLFNPSHFPDHDLLPLDRGTWRFFQFPVQAAVDVSEALQAHRAIAHQWRECAPAELIRA